MGTHQQPLAKQTKEIKTMFHSTNKAVILLLIVVISGTMSSGVKKENTEPSKEGGNEAITSLDKQRGKFFETRVLQIVQEKFDTIDLQIREIYHEMNEKRDELGSFFRQLIDALCDEARLKLSICQYTSG